MITVLEAINLSADFLGKKGISSPRINAELLLAYVLKCKRLELYLSFDRPLKQDELNNYRQLIKRRSNFEPLQYITGSVEFYSLEFTVTPDVLIPRPETELLVEAVLNNCRNKSNLKILDIGCGSGIIGITLAANLPGSKIFCTDISAEALRVASVNAGRHNVLSGITFLKHNIITEDISFTSEIDVAVSNPPYVSKDDFNGLQNEIKYFEPHSAVTDEADGLTFFKIIAQKVFGKLNSEGLLFFEVGQGQIEIVQSLLTACGYNDIKRIKDYQHIDRVIFGVKK